MVAVDPVFKRQLGDETAAGVSNSAIVVDTAAAADETGLVIDDNVASKTQEAPPPLIASGTRTPVVTSTLAVTSPPPEPTASEEVNTAEAIGASGKNISLTTVVGSCVAAFVGAALLIAIGFYFYRRYSASLKEKNRRRPLPRSAFSDNIRGAGGEGRNSKTWNRLDSGEFEDKWDGKDAGTAAAAAASRKTPDHLSVPPLEKMDMFNKKSPSASSHHGSGSDEQHGGAYEMQHHPYGQSSSLPPKMPEARDLLGREPQNALGQIDSGPPISWASSPSQTSFLSAARIESGAMSPTLAMAIPTPPATRSQPHRWESAEVVNLPEGQSAEYVDDDSHAGSRTSLHNPFFSGGGGDYYSPPRRARSGSQSTVRSRSGSVRSRRNSNATVTQLPASSSAPPVPDVTIKASDDNRLSMDPFNDPLPAPPSFIRHQATGSASSAASNERAIRQLVAAAGIDLSEDEIQRRLKAVSMQPSVISNSGDSMYTDADPDLAEEALKSFPKPPSSISSHGGPRI